MLKTIIAQVQSVIIRPEIIEITFRLAGQEEAEIDSDCPLE